MDGWALGLLEAVPVAIAAVIVARHFRAMRRADAVEEGASPSNARTRV